MTSSPTLPTIRVVVADDEPLARKKLRILLGAEAGIQIVAECKDGKQAIAALTTYHPDLLLLDIHMPEEDGFEVLKSAPPDCVPLVIFTTAYDKYAIKAFEAHALDYLLKPFDEERLHQAIERARKELQKSDHGHLARRLLDIIAAAQTGSGPDNRFVIRSGGRVIFLDVEDIDWIEAESNYVRFHAGKESYLLREGIGHVSERLDPHQFVRIHRSIIVNVQRIKELQPCNSGEYIVVLRDHQELSCSRGYRLGLQQLIEQSL